MSKSCGTCEYWKRVKETTEGECHYNPDSVQIGLFETDGDICDCYKESIYQCCGTCKYWIHGHSDYSVLLGRCIPVLPFWVKSMELWLSCSDGHTCNCWKNKK